MNLWSNLKNVPPKVYGIVFHDKMSEAWCRGESFTCKTNDTQQHHSMAIGLIFMLFYLFGMSLSLNKIFFYGELQSRKNQYYNLFMMIAFTDLENA